MNKSKLTTLVLIGLMAIIIGGLFFYNYQDSKIVMEEEAPVNEAALNNNFIKARYSTLSSEEQKVLIGEVKNSTILGTLYTKFQENEDNIGLGLCQAIYASSNKSDSLYSLAGNNLLNMPEAIKTQEDADFIFGKAKNVFEKALEINKNNLSANNGLALCLIDYDEQVMKGIGLLQHTLSLDSNNIEAIQYLGFLSIKSNQLEKAIERFKKLVDLQPSNFEHYNNLSQVYLRMGDKHKANLYLEMGKKLSENK